MGLREGKRCINIRLLLLHNKVPQMQHLKTTQYIYYPPISVAQESKYPQLGLLLKVVRYTVRESARAGFLQTHCPLLAHMFFVCICRIQFFVDLEFMVGSLLFQGQQERLLLVDLLLKGSLASSDPLRISSFLIDLKSTDQGSTLLLQNPCSVAV